MDFWTSFRDTYQKFGKIQCFNKNVEVVQSIHTIAYYLFNATRQFLRKSKNYQNGSTDEYVKTDQKLQNTLQNHTKITVKNHQK